MVKPDKVKRLKKSKSKRSWRNERQNFNEESDVRNELDTLTKMMLAELSFSFANMTFRLGSGKYEDAGTPDTFQTAEANQTHLTIFENANINEIQHIYLINLPTHNMQDNIRNNAELIE